MKNDTSGTFWRSAMVLIASVFALMLLASGSAALAGDDDDDDDDDDDGERITVSGNSTICEDGDCGLPGADLVLNMTGDLIGQLSIFVKSSECDEFEDFARYIERGKEIFEGKLKDGRSGKFRTRYVVEAIYAPGFCTSFNFFTQLAGGCIHKVRSGRRGFEGVHGKITFFDIIPQPGISGASNFFWFGDLNFEDD